MEGAVTHVHNVHVYELIKLHKSTCTSTQDIE